MLSRLSLQRDLSTVSLNRRNFFFCLDVKPLEAGATGSLFFVKMVLFKSKKMPEWSESTLSSSCREPVEIVLSKTN